MAKRRVSYFYDEDIGNFHYGIGHPMKPHRIRMTHELILTYGLYRKMEIYRPPLLTEDSLTLFHSDDYVHFLQNVSVETQAAYGAEFQRFNIDVDCPIFDGLYKYCQLYSGGSVAGFSLFSSISLSISPSLPG
jgi:histone deacetylase 1/2